MDAQCLGFDTSNYTTSAAVFGGGRAENRGRLLTVPEGALGLRQSDALFQHVKRLHQMVEQLRADGVVGSIAAVGASTRPREVEGSYMPCFLVGEGEGRALAAALGVPFYPCSHQQGHVAAAAWSAGREDLLDRPHLAWHLSGGTTELLLVEPDGVNLKAERIGDGVLYEFETELTAVLRVEALRERLADMRIYCGESRDEALDKEHCYYSWAPDRSTGETLRCAVRFAFIPGEEVGLTAIHQFVDIPVRAAFRCGNPLLNQIWAVAAHTFRLCTGIFFIDGVKRDKWIWSGDAYQSLFVNQYLLADPGVEQRTLLALRGNDPMTGHINTIMDYSLLWLLGVKEHFDTYGDRDFLALVWPKAASQVEFCRARTDDSGFLTAGEGDWVFIDWAELDKDGPFAPEQVLLCACWGAAAELAEALGLDGREYRARREALAARIVEYREEHGPFEAVEDLTNVSGIGQGKLAALEGLVTVEDSE